MISYHDIVIVILKLELAYNQNVNFFHKLKPKPSWIMIHVSSHVVPTVQNTSFQDAMLS